MLVLRVAWRNLCFRPVLTVVTLALLGLAVVQTTVVILLARAFEAGLVRASRPFDLLVGAKGSPTQLLMSTVLLQEAPVGNLPLAYFEQLQHDPRVAYAVPLAMGDSVYGTPLLGVGPEFAGLSDPATGQPYFALTQGRFAEQAFEAVAGAQAARHWQLGDTFQSHHGGLQAGPGEAHEAWYTIVGILAPSDTPWDRALFVPLASYWEVHHEHDTAEQQVTVALLRPRGVKEFYQLHQEINRESVAQAVLTGQGMARLFDMLGQGETVLRLASCLALAMGAATVFLASYAVGVQRRRETAILRALGAGRWAMCLVGLVEALLTALMSVLLGMATAHVIAWYIARRIHDASAIVLHPVWVPAELGIAGAVLLLAAAAGLLPAVQAYHQDVASNL